MLGCLPAINQAFWDGKFRAGKHASDAEIRGGKWAGWEKEMANRGFALSAGVKWRWASLVVGRGVGEDTGNGFAVLEILTENAKSAVTLFEEFVRR